MIKRYSDFVITGPAPLVEGQTTRWPALKKDLAEVVEEPVKEETDRYYFDPKDEYYDAPTVCKRCQATFIAYDKDNKYIFNYCPGCGRKLKVSQRKRK